MGHRSCNKILKEKHPCVTNLCTTPEKGCRPEVFSQIQIMTEKLPLSQNIETPSTLGLIAQFVDDRVVNLQCIGSNPALPKFSLFQIISKWVNLDVFCFFLFFFSSIF